MSTLHSPVMSDFPTQVAIGTKKVGEGNPCYVIAEAGSNHDKNLKKALKLVDIAAEAGCDAVKFQSFSGEDIATDYPCPETKLPDAFRRWGKTLQELYKNCAMPDEFYEPLFKRANERGIHFMSSPFSEAAVDRLMKLGVPALKIASFELVHLPLVRHAASSGLPLILSTGMAGLGDIERALDAAAKGGGNKVVLMHCGSSYPLNAASANLRVMQTLRLAFQVPVGYSDHTLGIAIPIAAAALGANIFEKHFTESRSGDGPDHPFAIEPMELKSMAEGMRTAELAVGSTIKRRLKEEALSAKNGRRSLFASKDLRQGETLTRTSVSVLRPAIGLEPLTLELILGKKLNRAIKKGAPLKWKHFVSSTP